ncbi:MAG TPA: ATP-binding domain-containing protein [Kineosporiaceae bacterium]|nr:ATP-binding domain-containing protein [Kineosporiaceae bacterium]
MPDVVEPDRRSRPTADPDPLTAEQRYLASAREHLARMRERTLSLDVQGGDAVSAEFLARTLHRRARSLVDDPATALFFGRTDHSDGERWYVGRRHVADEHGDPVVVDWRADVSRAFYRASRTEPMGVERRRRFGIEAGRITAYEDEHLSDPAEATGRSAILAREIERPRVGPMRDIVATIQPEQDEIVRAGAATTVCVQGAPGTGKTAVGLHRAAWLLYAYRDKLARSGVLVVGPNKAFLEHVGAVLPSLGEVEVRHTTVEDLVAGEASHSADDDGVRQVRTGVVHARGADPVPVAVLKGDARLATVLHRAVWAHVGDPQEPLVLPRGSRRWRLPAHEVREIVAELRARGARYTAAREMLAHRLAHAILVLMEEAGDSPDDRVQDAVARSRDVRRYVDAVWPPLEPRAVLHRLFTDGPFLAACADGVLTPDEVELLLWSPPPRSRASARWSPADVVLLDELADVLRRTPSLGHVVLDEAQDLSPMQLRAVGRRCSTGAATVLGDIAQGTTPWATPSWEVALTHLGHPDAHLEVLDRGFRVPAAVISFAARLLPSIAPGMSAPTSVRDDPGSLVVWQVGTAGLWGQMLDSVLEGLAGEGSIGVIVPDGWVRRAAKMLAAVDIEHHVLGGPPVDGVPPRVSLVPATTAKGLEFDRVVVIEPTQMALDEPDERTGLRRLYVVLTRAVTALTVVHALPLPRLLQEGLAKP